MADPEKKNVLKEKSFAFSIRVVKLYQFLKKEHQEYELAKQVLRSGTSVAANIEEAVGGYSRKDFYARLGIAYKEARETRFWLRLLNSTELLEQKLFESLENDCNELIKLLIAILKTNKDRPL
jgi:four helix bundle protein